MPKTGYARFPSASSVGRRPRAQQAALGAARVFLQRLLADDGPPLASLAR